jgi:hypothetical protein
MATAGGGGEGGGGAGDGSLVVEIIKYIDSVDPRLRFKAEALIAKYNKNGDRALTAGELAFLGFCFQNIIYVLNA